MSCRHDLALGTCKPCYPDSGTIEPTYFGPSLDGPEAVPATKDEIVKQIAHFVESESSNYTDLARKIRDNFSSV